MKRLSKIPTILVTVSSLFLISFVLYSLFYGFYFTGDTISYLQYAHEGGPLTVFVRHIYTWPPLTALVFNLLRNLPAGVYSQQKTYILISFLLGFIAIYKIGELLSWPGTFRVIAATLCLLGGIQILIYQSSLSETLFSSLILLSAFFLINFLILPKESNLFPIVITSSLLPLSRYIGIPILIYISVVLIVFMVTSRGRKNLSRFLIIYSILLAFIPVSFYLFKNKIQIGSLFGPRDLQHSSVIFQTIFKTNFFMLITDLKYQLPTSILLGFCFLRSKIHKLPLLILSGYFVIYFLSVLSSLKILYLFENFPSRYLSPIYPVIILVGLILGSSLPKYLSRKKIFLWLVAICISGFFITISINQFKNLLKEREMLGSRVEGTEFSGDIFKICYQDKQRERVVYVNPLDRNWVVQGLKYFCQPISLLEAPKSYQLPSNLYLFTTYKLREEDGLKLTWLYNGQKEMYVYLTVNRYNLDMSKVIKD